MERKRAGVRRLRPHSPRCTVKPQRNTGSGCVVSGTSLLLPYLRLMLLLMKYLPVLRLRCEMGADLMMWQGASCESGRLSCRRKPVNWPCGDQVRSTHWPMRSRASRCWPCMPCSISRVPTCQTLVPSGVGLGRLETIWRKRTRPSCSGLVRSFVTHASRSASALLPEEQRRLSLLTRSDGRVRPDVGRQLMKQLPRDGHGLAALVSDVGGGT